jgi:hypothetical protein
MKALMMLGALIGFLIGGGFGLAGQSPWPQALWRAGAAALMAAVLTRWWSRAWLRGLQETWARRQQEPPAPAVNPKPKTSL